eukprot:TRINITY_DN1217_c3_g1_i1.p2 TRINITY_DN1217_c3_g1~~TRINITY_DN1217_c3_g1_i1.p2  ORF type:complete len:164 (+),score=34.14 TRINITY_DN1217_c3_g1_i1:246-737(+)
MKAFPAVKEFVDSHAGNFKRVEVRGKPGAPYPILYFIGKHNNVIKAGYKFTGRQETVEWIYDWLRDNAGITPDSPAPEFVEEPFPPTEHCIAFRAHTPEGGEAARNHELFPFDKPCGKFVNTPHPGYCYCTDGSRVLMEYFTDKVREQFRCEDVCADKMQKEL